MITNEKETQNVGKVGAKRREKKVGIKLTIQLVCLQKQTMGPGLLAHG